MVIAIPVGMVLTTFYEAGAFDHLIWCVTEVAHDIREFCKIEKDEKEPL